MLYDRPYMREGYGPAPGKTSMVTILLVVTIGVFVLQNVIHVALPGKGDFLWEWFALSGAHFQQLKVWTVLSYAFLHSTHSLIHILGNMLGLFFIGRILEPIIGRQRFLQFYLGSAVVSGLVYLAFHFSGANPVVGASGAVFAMLAFFCLLRPDQPITLLLFFVLPVTMKPKWVFWGALGISVFGLLFYELRNTGGTRPGIAHSAHLGGMLAGILYYRFIHHASKPFARPSAKPSVELPDWFKAKKQAKRDYGYQVNRTNRDDVQKEVDRILDKINSSGFGSLTDEEKATLDRARDILSK